jgi:hypothetical protein
LVPYAAELLLPLLLLLQGMNFVAGALLLVLTGGGRQQQHCSSSTAPASQPDAATAPGRPCRVSSSSNSSGEDPAAAAAAAAAGLEGPESLAFGCLLAVAEHVLPGYYSPAMVAPQVGAMSLILSTAAVRCNVVSCVEQLNFLISMCFPATTSLPWWHHRWGIAATSEANSGAAGSFSILYVCRSVCATAG